MATTTSKHQRTKQSSPKVKKRRAKVVKNANKSGKRLLAKKLVVEVAGEATNDFATGETKEVSPVLPQSRFGQWWSQHSNLWQKYELSQRRLPAWTAKAVLILGVTLGLNLILAGGWYILYRRTVLSFTASPVITTNHELRGALPMSVSIPALQFDKPLVPADIENGIWEISKTHPAYLVSSARPAEGGNIVIYGHRLKHIFANLSRLKPGDSISVTTDNGKVFEYQVTETKVVKPDDIAVVMPTDYEVLTVYTCTGWFDSQRLVVKAKPVRVSSR